MKKFKVENTLGIGSPYEFTEVEPPDWLLTKKWWYDRYVLHLEIGQGAKVCTNRITRIA